MELAVSKNEANRHNIQMRTQLQGGYQMVFSQLGVRKNSKAEEYARFPASAGSLYMCVLQL